MPRERNRDIDGLSLPDSLSPDQPKGDQIRGIILSLTRRLGPGAILPSERMLAERYDVARMTVRGALRALEAEGAVIIRPGVGTFAAAARRSRAVGSWFSRDMRARGMKPETRTIEQAVVTLPASLAHRLDAPPGSRAITLVRLCLADGMPMAIERATLSLERFPGLEDSPLGGELLDDVLHHRWGVVPRSVKASVRATLPTTGEATLLEVSQSQACLVVSAIQRDTTGAPIEARRAIYRGDRYDVELSYQIPLP
ncbi:MAG: GntR family transcriptional regulator [Nostocoides sp.]